MKLVNFLSKYYLLFCFIISCLIASTIYYQFLQALNTDLDALSWSITQEGPKATAMGRIGAVEGVKEVLTAQVYAYNSEVGQTDANPNIMANGEAPDASSVACPVRYLFGTKVKINGKVYICEDRMSGRYQEGNFFDIWMPEKQMAIDWGVRTLEVKILK